MWTRPIAFDILMSFMPVLMAIFRRTSAKTWGPVIGAAVFAYLEEILRLNIPSVYMIIFGVIMMVAILFLPDGLVGLRRKTAYQKKGGRMIMPILEAGGVTKSVRRVDRSFRRWTFLSMKARSSV